MSWFEKQHAVVTGGGSGIGAAIAARLARDHHVVGHVRENRGAHIGTSIEARGSIGPADDQPRTQLSRVQISP